MNTTEQLTTALTARERHAPDPDELLRLVQNTAPTDDAGAPRAAQRPARQPRWLRPALLAAAVVAVVTTAVAVVHVNRQPEPASHPAPSTELAATPNHATSTASAADSSADRRTTDPLSIIGRDWLVVAATRNGSAVDIDPTVPFVVRFDGKGGTIGKDGCNDFRGTADVGRGTVRVGGSSEITTVGCQASTVPFGGDFHWYLDGEELHLTGENAVLVLREATSSSNSSTPTVGSASVPTCGRMWHVRTASSRLDAVATWPSTLQINRPVSVSAELTNTGTTAISGSYSWELVLLDNTGVVVADMPKATLDLQMISVPAGGTTQVRAHAVTLIPCREGALQVGAQYTAVYIAQVDTLARAAVSEPGAVTISA